MFEFDVFEDMRSRSSVLIVDDEPQTRTVYILINDENYT